MIGNRCLVAKGKYSEVHKCPQIEDTAVLQTKAIEENMPRTVNSQVKILRQRQSVEKPKMLWIVV